MSKKVKHIEWRNIDTKGIYQVSVCGKVRSRLGKGVRHPRKAYVMLKGHSIQGYRSIEIHGTHKFVHVAVLEAFVGPRPPGYDAAHLDGSKDNNHLSNLAWVTREENQRHRKIHSPNSWARGSRTHHAKLDETQVKEIKCLLSQGVRGVAIAQQFQVTQSTISCIKKGKTWAHV